MSFLQTSGFRIVGPVGPSITQLAKVIGPILAGLGRGAGKGLPTIIRPRGGRGGGLGATPKPTPKAGPGALPKASGAIRTISQGGITRAGLNLSGRQVAIIGVSGATLGGIGLLSQPGTGPGGIGTGPTGFQTLTQGAVDTSENIGEGIKDIVPSLENLSQFVQENGLLLTVIGIGIVAIVLIK